MRSEVINYIAEVTSYVTEVLLCLFVMLYECCSTCNIVYVITVLAITWYCQTSTVFMFVDCT